MRHGELLSMVQQQHINNATACPLRPEAYDSGKSPGLNNATIPVVVCPAGEVNSAKDSSPPLVLSDKPKIISNDAHDSLQQGDKSIVKQADNAMSAHNEEVAICSISKGTMNGTTLVQLDRTSAVHSGAEKSPESNYSEPGRSKGVESSTNGNSDVTNSEEEISPESVASEAENSPRESSLKTDKPETEKPPTTDNAGVEKSQRESSATPGNSETEKPPKTDNAGAEKSEGGSSAATGTEESSEGKNPESTTSESVKSKGKSSATTGNPEAEKPKEDNPAAHGNTDAQKPDNEVTSPKNNKSPAEKSSGDRTENTSLEHDKSDDDGAKSEEAEISPTSPSLAPNCVSSFEFCTAKQLTNEVVEELLHLTKHNMKEYYMESDWGWDDVTKRGELCQDQMYYIIVRSHTVRGLVNCEACPSCNAKSDNQKTQKQHTSVAKPKAKKTSKTTTEISKMFTDSDNSKNASTQPAVNLNNAKEATNMDTDNCTNGPHITDTDNTNKGCTANTNKGCTNNETTDKKQDHILHPGSPVTKSKSQQHETSMPYSPLKLSGSPIPIVKCIIKFGKPVSGTRRSNVLNASARSEVVRTETPCAMASSASNVEYTSKLKTDTKGATCTKQHLNRNSTIEDLSNKNAGKLVGFAAFRLTVDNGVPLLYLRELQLVPEIRGKGLGAYLMKHIERIALRSDKSIVMLTVFSSNKQAMKFYSKIGYTLDEASPGLCYTTTTSPYEIMSKALDPELLRIPCTYEGCASRFRFYNGLRQHLCADHGEPWPHPCTFDGCNQGVVLPSQLSQHMKSHGVECGEEGSGHADDGTSAAEYSIQTRHSSSNGGVRTGSAKSNETAKLLFQRVVVNKNGRKGTILKANGSGVYKIKLDGPGRDIVRLRRGLFAAKGVGTYVPKKRKERDPDWEFAMLLQRQESRRSARAPTSNVT